MIKNIAEYPVRVIMNEIKNGMDDLIPEYQRLYVWNKERQSKFVRHVLYGFPTHKVFIDDRNDEWLILDGQQRITTLYRFINNEFSLDNSGVDNISKACWNGKYFKDLDKKFQKSIMSYTLSCEMITSADAWEIEGLFDGLNSGMPLGKITEILLRDIKIKSVLNKMKEYPFINPIIKNMSENDIKKQEDDLLALRILCIFSNGVIGLDGDSLESCLVTKQLHNTLETTLNRIERVCAKIASAYDGSVFGGRKIVSYHSIPTFLLFVEDKDKKTIDLACKELSTNQTKIAEFRAMNRSNTASKSKQEQRLEFYNSLLV